MSIVPKGLTKNKLPKIICTFVRAQDLVVLRSRSVPQGWDVFLTESPKEQTIDSTLTRFN